MAARKPRRFQYTPFKYDPDKESGDYSEKRLQFKKLGGRASGPFTLARLVVILAAALIAFYYLTRVMRQGHF